MLLIDFPRRTQKGWGLWQVPTPFFWTYLCQNHFFIEWKLWNRSFQDFHCNRPIVAIEFKVFDVVLLFLYLKKTYKISNCLKKINIMI